jgi:hypothetical protein
VTRVLMRPRQGDDMAKTIIIRKREYQIEINDRVTATGEIDRQYLLRGKRGALYGTMRNVHHRSRMFVVATTGYSNVMDGVWLDDSSGELVVVSR